MSRSAQINRTTRETAIELQLELDGKGKASIETTIPFFNHMLDLFTFHGEFNLQIKASGDTEVDFHHTVEDVGICLGKALHQALGSREGINRYGFFSLPMDEALADISLDISGRPFFVYTGPQLKGKTGQFDVELVDEFLRALTIHAGLTLHVDVRRGENLHHIIEAVFKCLGRTLKTAVACGSFQGVPSTKGSLD